MKGNSCNKDPQDCQQLSKMRMFSQQFLLILTMYMLRKVIHYWWNWFYERRWRKRHMRPNILVLLIFFYAWNNLHMEEVVELELPRNACFFQSGLCKGIDYWWKLILWKATAACCNTPKKIKACFYQSVLHVMW